MMDAFAELGLERDLRVSEEGLRRSYDQLSGVRHPDSGGSREEFSRLREAYGLVRSPARRLRHWLELEGVTAPKIGVVPEELMGLFGEVGALLQRLEAVRAKKAGARSVLVRSMAEREAMEVAESLEALRGRLAEWTAGMEGRFEEFQEQGAQGCAEEALGVAGSMAFLEKWEAQVQEAWVSMAM